MTFWVADCGKQVLTLFICDGGKYSIISQLSYWKLTLYRPFNEQIRHVLPIMRGLVCMQYLTTKIAFT